MSENELAVENGIRTDIAENFISGLKVLFENSWIDVPDEKYDILTDMEDNKNGLEEQLNTALQENIQLHKEVLAHRCGEIFTEEADGLTDLEVEKLASLTEGIEFETENQYRSKITVLRESYFGKSTPVLSEEYESTVEDTSVDDGGPMDKYLNTISRHSHYNKTS